MSDKISVDFITKEYYHEVYKFCCSRCRNAEVAQDITQDTFLLLISKKDELFNENIHSWLFKVADNKLHEYFRKNSFEKNFVNIDAVDIPTFDTYDYENINIDEIFDDVQQKILNMLNEKEKELFIKLYIEKKSVSLIVKELEITEGNLYVKKSRLKNKIKNSIGHLYFFMFVLSFKLFH